MSIGNRPLSPGTSKDKRNSSNKFELRDGVVFKTVVIPPVAPECSAPLILKPNTGQKPGPALSTGHRHVYNFTVNISNLLSVVANTHDSPMQKKKKVPITLSSRWLYQQRLISKPAAGYDPNPAPTQLQAFRLYFVRRIYTEMCVLLA